jgi:hypothetical protein
VSRSRPINRPLATWFFRVRIFPAFWRTALTQRLRLAEFRNSRSGWHSSSYEETGLGGTIGSEYDSTGNFAQFGNFGAAVTSEMPARFRMARLIPTRGNRSEHRYRPDPGPHCGLKALISAAYAVV